MFLRSLFAATLFVLLLAPAAAYSQTPTCAFYYNQQNKLLQIENLTAVTNFSDRLLQDIGSFPIPRMTTKKNADLIVGCPAPLNPQSMSNAARYVIYYGANNPGDFTEKARPLKLEFVSDVTRDLKCQQVFENSGCPTGLRCMTGCAGCPSYCCVP